MSDEQKTDQETPTPSEEKKEEENAFPTVEEIKKERLDRSLLCRKEVSALLEKYNCYPDVFVRIGTDGSIKGTFEINPR